MEKPANDLTPLRDVLQPMLDRLRDDVPQEERAAVIAEIYRRADEERWRDRASAPLTRPR